jgi:hypothetical protein
MISSNLKFELYKATDPLSGDPVFIKSLKDFKSRPNEFKEHIKEAVKNSHLIRHPNLILLNQWVLTNNNMYLIFD